MLNRAIEAATGNWSEKQMFWNNSLKPLGNICEKIHFLINRQAVGLQPHWIWSLSQVFLLILTTGFQGNFCGHYFSEHFFRTPSTGVCCLGKGVSVLMIKLMIKN